MQLTSEITTTSIDIDIPNYPLQYYKDNYTLFVDEYTKHLEATKTRYSEVFYFYKNDSVIGLNLRHYGEYTDKEVQILNSLMQPGFVVYDIGANIGYHSVGLAQRAKRVYSFEPNEKNLYLLKLNTRLLPNVEVLEYAVSDDVGMTMVEEYDLNERGNYGELHTSDKGQLCRMTTIDQLLNDKVIEPPNIVKIDVEGHEWRVIQGMQETIKNNLPVIMYENMHGSDLPKVYDYLKNLAYDLYWFPAAYYNKDNFKRNEQNIWAPGASVINVLATPFYMKANTNLPPMISNDDTWAKAVERIKNAQKH